MDAQHPVADQRQSTHGQDAPQRAAQVVAGLLVHLMPDDADQSVVGRDELRQPAQDGLLVLEHEEHQHWHQEQIDQGHGKSLAEAQRVGQDHLAPGQQVGAEAVDHVGDLFFREELRIAARQLQEQRLAIGNQGGQPLQPLDHLPGQERHQSEYGSGQRAGKGAKNDHHGPQAAQPLALQITHHGIQQVGQNDGGQQRCQQISSHGEHHEEQQQQATQRQSLGVSHQVSQP